MKKKNKSIQIYKIITIILAAIMIIAMILSAIRF